MEPITVAVSLTVMASVMVFTDAHCECGRKVMAIPGRHIISTRSFKTEAERSGRGAVVHCQRCKSLVEVTHK